MRSKGLTIYNINGVRKQLGNVPCQADKSKKIELRLRIQVYQNIDIAIGARLPPYDRSEHSCMAYTACL
jgi:hypothetical protein